MRTWEQELNRAIEAITEQHGNDYTIELHAVGSKDNISLRVSYVIDIGSRSLKYPFRQIDDIVDMKSLDQIIMASVRRLIVSSVPVLIYKEVK